jgi:hypothetical protein
MSKIFVDQVDPKTATTLTLGTSGDTVSIPSGVTIANSGTATGFGVALTGSTDNQVVTVTGANAIAGETNFTYDGTDVTLTSGSIKFATDGEGLNFSGASRSATLDDYEEGSWTPTVTGGSSDPTQSYAKQVGHYVKIGNMVQIQAYVQMAGSGVSGGSGTDCFVSNFPFTSKNTTNQRCAIDVGYSTAWGTTRGCPTNSALNPNGTRTFLKVQNNASNILSDTLTQSSPADVTNDTAVVIQGCYFTE